MVNQMCGDMKLVPVRPEATNADGVGVGEVLNEPTLRVQVLNLERVQVALGALPHQGYVLQKRHSLQARGGGAICDWPTKGGCKVSIRVSQRGVVCQC